MVLKKIYYINCNKYRKFKNPEISYHFDQTLVFFPLFVIRAAVMMKNILKKKNQLRYQKISV